MEEFDFEELIADMLGITDEQRNDGDCIREIFYDKFELDYYNAYYFVKSLLPHAPVVQAGVNKELFHAFVAKDEPVMLMKMKAS